MQLFDLCQNSNDQTPPLLFLFFLGFYIGFDWILRLAGEILIINQGPRQ